MEDIFGKILFGILILIILILVFVIGLATFKVLDSSLLPKENGIGTIVAKEYRRPYITTTILVVGKVPHTQIVRHPEKFILNISVDSDTSDLSVKKLDWERLDIEDRIKVMYSRGRFTNELYIK